MSDELVWVDDGISPIVAAFGTEYTRPVWIRKPIQVKKSEVTMAMRVLDSQTLKMYNTCIAEVESRRKAKEKKGKDAI